MQNSYFIPILIIAFTLTTSLIIYWRRRDRLAREEADLRARLGRPAAQPSPPLPPRQGYGRIHRLHNATQPAKRSPTPAWSEPLQNTYWVDDANYGCAGDSGSSSSCDSSSSSSSCDSGGGGDSGGCGGD